MSYPNAALLIIVLASPVFCSGCRADEDFDRSSTRNVGQDEGKVLTIAKYERIKAGMTYRELITLLNVPPEHQPEDIEDLESRTAVSLTWFTAAGPRLTVILRKGKVIEKRQRGLQ